MENQNLTATPEKKVYVWPLWSMVLVSILLGMVAGYFLTWRNMIRMGLSNDKRKQFLIIGFLVVISVIFILSHIELKRTSSISGPLSVMFPVWLYYTYQKQWEKEHPGGTKTTWGVLGWGMLGLFSFFMLGAIFIIFGISG